MDWVHGQMVPKCPFHLQERITGVADSAGKSDSLGEWVQLLCVGLSLFRSIREKVFLIIRRWLYVLRLISD